ncbi:MAG: ParB/RepB/Spo0J family partition protein [SAR324 cluster bacterium]|nr:ParB/RepB/Spo0J family partition protein [SAR324 cluster bacterium]
MMPTESQETILRLSLDQILPNPLQPRRRFDEESLRGLAQSIRSQGMIQPLIVRKSPLGDGLYELVAGERRWRAIQFTGLREIEVVVKEIDDNDLREVALLENIQRENLTPIEEAACYRDLLEEHGYTQEVLARRIGKDRSTIANLMRLLQLPDAIQNDVEESRLTVGHSRSLLSLPGADEQMYIREKILKNNWSVRQTEKEVKALISTLTDEKNLSPEQVKSKRSNELNLQLKTLENEMEKHFGSKVSIQYQSNGRGSIKIEYYSLDDFDRIYDLLKPV